MRVASRIVTRFGYVLPSSTGTDVQSPDSIWEVADAADASSLETLWVSDHLLWWHPMYESLALVAAIAARTKRIGMGPAVLQLAMRETVATAKALASIQRLSKGRLTVGVGVGGEFPPEWEATGTSRKTRGKRTDEMLDAMTRLWGPEAVTYGGRHVRLEGVDLHPKPTAPPPIWIGGRKEPSFRRAARFGEGWMGIFLTPEMYAAAAAALRELTDRHLARALYVWTAIADTDDQAREDADSLLSSFYNVPFERLERYAVVGSPSTCAARFREFADAGADHIAVAPIARAVSAEQLRRLTDEVAPLV